MNMRRILMVMGLATLVALPSVASARGYCQQRAHERKVAGTVIGAVGGALVGNAISHRNGALIGGLGGAVIGNQVARVKCDTGRAYYRSRASTRRSYAGRRDTRYASYDTRTAYGACSYENRPFYDERGQLIYAPTRICR
jgi:uncharacterized protein YcfJ